MQGINETHTVTLDAKGKPDMWAQWTKKTNPTLVQLASGVARVEEAVSIRETHKIIIATPSGAAREQFVSLEFESRVTLAAAQTVEDILAAKDIARELLTKGQHEWIEAIREDALARAKEGLRRG